MRLLRELLLQLGALFQRRRISEEIDAEMEQHLEFMAADFEAQGMSPKEARQAALRKFGHVEGHKEAARDSWGSRGIFDTIRDFKFGLRLLGRYRGSSVMAVITLSLGIAIATMLFTVSDRLVDGSRFNRLDGKYVEVDWDNGTRWGKMFNSHDFKFFRERLESLKDIGGYQLSSFWLGEGRVSEKGRRLRGVYVSPNLVSSEKVSFLLGDGFGDGVEEGDALVSESVWTLDFERDPEVVGKRILLDDRYYRIAGVIPAGYLAMGQQDVWVATDWSRYDRAERLDTPVVKLVGGIRSGFDEEAVEAEFRELSKKLRELYPETNADYEAVRIKNVRAVYSSGNAVLILGLGSVAAGIVLAMACVSVFNIVMCRTADRTRELAMRCAMGAKRSHVIWQVVVDGVVLSGLGAAVGITLASYLLRKSALFFEGGGLPGLHLFRMEPIVIWVAVCAALGSGIVSSFLPAWRASRMDPYRELKSGDRATSGIFIGWLSKLSVLGQATCSSILVFLGSMFLLSTLAFRGMDTTFDKDSIVAVKMELWGDAKLSTEAGVKAFVGDVQGKVELDTGIEAAAFTSKQYGFFASGSRFVLEGLEEQTEEMGAKAIVSSVTNEYLKVHDWEPLSGRMFDARDTADSEPVAMVSAGLVKTYFGEKDPLGIRIRIQTEDEEFSDWIRVVGVIPDMSLVMEGAEEAMSRAFGEIVRPFSQRIEWNPTLLVRVKDPEDPRHLEMIRGIVHEIAPLVFLRGSMRSLGEGVEILGHFSKGLATASTLFGVSILVMSMMGLHAMVNFTSNRRRKEFGIRMVVGSTRGGIIKALFGPWAFAISLGLVLGGLIILGMVWIYLAWVARVSGGEVNNLMEFLIPIGLSISLIVLTSGGAILWPAWKASKMDPMDVIRFE